MRDITYKGETYTINSHSAEYLEKDGVILNDEYFDWLLQFRSTIENGLLMEIRRLVDCDIGNRIAMKKLGGFVVYKDDKVVPYSSLVDVVFDNYDEEPCVSFGIYDKEKISVKKQDVPFFGVSIPTMFPLLLRVLSEEIHECYVWKNGKGSVASYEYYLGSRNTKTISFEEFKKQHLKFRTFSIGTSLIHSYNRIHGFKDERKNFDFGGYNLCLKRLLDRYSINGETIFEEVTDLNDYGHYTGIYVLCLDEERGFYVGQASKSFKKRIVQHFTSKQSDFDRRHTANEVNRIFILHTNFEFMDAVEQDCIATLYLEEQKLKNNTDLPHSTEYQKGYVLNTMAGGEAIVSIGGENYNPTCYQMSKKLLQKIIDKSSSDKRQCDEGVEFELQMKRGQVATKKIKSLKENRITFELCEDALYYEPLNFEYIPVKFRTKELCEEAVRLCGNNLKFVPEEYRTESMCKRAIMEGYADASIVPYIPEDILTEEFLLSVGSSVRRITKELPKELKTEKVMSLAGYRKKK